MTRKIRRWLTARWKPLSTAASTIALLVGFFSDVGPVFRSARCFIVGCAPHPELTTYWTDGNQNVAGGRVLTPSVDLRTPDGAEVPVDIRLAIRNIGKGAIGAGQVYIQYPEGLAVRSSGVASQEPGRRVFAYRTAVDALMPGSDWHFLKLVDTLHLRVTRRDSARVGIALGALEVPYYERRAQFSWAPLHAGEAGRRYEIPLDVDVVTSAGRRIEGKVILRLPVFGRHTEYYGLPTLGYRAAPDADAVVARGLAAPLVRGPLTAHVVGDDRRTYVVTYEERVDAAAEMQIVMFDGAIRLVVIDEGRDGMVDRHVVLGTDQRAADAIFGPPPPLVRWDDSVFASR